MISEDKWAWKMDWCKRRGLDPAIPYNWQSAEQAWREYQESNRLIEEYLRQKGDKSSKELLDKLLSKE